VKRAKIREMEDKRRWIMITALGVACAVTLVAGAASVTAFAYQNRIQPRTVIAGASISNFSREAAETAIRQKQEELAQASLAVTYNEQTATLALKDLGVSIAGPEHNVVGAPNNPWDWADPNYWKTFFSRKEIGLEYHFDREVAQKKLEEIFGVATSAENAKLIVTNGSLEVVPARSGESIGIDNLVTAIHRLLKSGQRRPVMVASAIVEPSISTEAAHRTRTEIENNLQPIYLSGEGKSFTIPVVHQYDLLKYEPANGELRWEIDDDKLKSYLTTKIAGRLNVKMVQRTIQQDTQQVIQEGKDGKSVELPTLLSTVKRTITERIPTRQAPVTIPVQTVAFTEKIVTPGYVAGLFEGLYVDINISRQTLYIMNGRTNTGSYLISSGKRGTPTPLGLFYVKNKIPIAQSRLYPGIWMRNWNALARNADGSGYEGYGIHDLPAFNAEYTLVEGASHLGRPVSHGCVRLGHAASVWFYQNIPVGTPVNIHLN